MCPVCQQWLPDTREYFERDLKVCKKCLAERRAERKAKEQKAIKAATLQGLIEQGDRLRQLPQGEEIVRACVRSFNGPEGIAQEMYSLFNETTSTHVKKDILKTLLTAAVDIDRGRPRAELGQLSDSELNDLIEARVTQLQATLQRKQQLALGLEGDGSGTSDPGLQSNG